MKMNFAVIGTNFITDLFLEAAEMAEDFQLKGVYSRSMEKAKAFAGKHHAELAFDNLEELAACQEIDAVYIASPNSLHAPQSILMMQHGKHVICEKPIASNLKEFEQMKAAAMENHVVLLEAMRNAHSPGFAVIRENLPKLGTIRRVSFQFCQYSRRYDNFKKGTIENAFNPELSNAALMDIGVYCVHPMTALFGRPNRVISSSLKLTNGFEGAGTVLLEYDGMQAELIYSKITKAEVPSQIQGEEATMVIQSVPKLQTAAIYYRNGNVEHLDIPAAENDMIYELETFIRLIRQNEYEHPYLENSQMEMELMDTVRRQQGIIFPADHI